MEDDLIKNADIDKIALQGEKVYESVKAKYEPQENGKFLAIEIDSHDVFLENAAKTRWIWPSKSIPIEFFTW